MTWIKLNDNAPRHPKVARLSDRAFRAWIEGLCHASEWLTDGVLPAAFVGRFPQRVLSELIELGLWTCPEDGRVHIHDYLQHQSSKAEIEAERARNRVRRTGGTTGGSTGGVPAPEKRRVEERRDPPVRPPRGQTKQALPRGVTLGARKDPHAN